LQPNDNSSTFKADATFYQRRGLANDDWASYESFNVPGQYLMHRDFKLYIAAPSTQQEKADATFAKALAVTPAPPIVTPPVIEPPIVTPPVITPPIIDPSVVPPIETPSEPTTPTTAGALGLLDFISACALWLFYSLGHAKQKR
jgi:hypothetical protein